jgi:hypothetical protein
MYSNPKGYAKKSRDNNTNNITEGNFENTACYAWLYYAQTEETSQKHPVTTVKWRYGMR